MNVDHLALGDYEDYLYSHENTSNGPYIDTSRRTVFGICTLLGRSKWGDGSQEQPDVGRTPAMIASRVPDLQTCQGSQRSAVVRTTRYLDISLASSRICPQKSVCQYYKGSLTLGTCWVLPLVVTVAIGPTLSYQAG